MGSRNPGLVFAGHTALLPNCKAFCVPARCDCGESFPTSSPTLLSVVSPEL